MKNRMKIKDALILYLEKELRLKCKNDGVPDRYVDKFILSSKEDLEQGAEIILKEHDDFLIDTFSEAIVYKLGENLSSDENFLRATFQDLKNIITSNHNSLNNGINLLSVYNQIILNEEIQRLEDDYELLINHKEALERIAKIEANKVSWGFTILFFSSLILWCFLILKYGWDAMEKWTYISGLIIILLNGIYYAIFEANFTSESLRKKKYEKMVKHIFQLYKFDLTQIPKTKNKLDKKRVELERLKDSIQ